MFVLYLYKDSIFNLFENHNLKALAEITHFKNNVKKKDSRSIDFRIVDKKDFLFQGDSLSTGSASSAHITFSTGNSITVDQNSLIFFDEQSEIPEFVKGNIKLTINGKMKLKFNNEVIELDGRNTKAAIQIYKDEKRKNQKIVLLSGEAQIKTPAANQSINLLKNIPIEAKNLIKADEILSSKEEILPYVATALVSVRNINKVEADSLKFYKLYDYYTRLLSSSTELGLNSKFDLNPLFQFRTFEHANLEVKTANLDYFLRIDDVQKAQGYVVEISKENSFKPETTHRFWVDKSYKGQILESGQYFIRYRKVLEDQILTEYSPVESISFQKKVDPVPNLNLVKEPPDLEIEPLQDLENSQSIPLPAYTGEKILESKPDLKKIEEPTNSIKEKVKSVATIYKPKAFDFYFDNRFNQFSITSETANSRAQISTQRDLNLKFSWSRERNLIWKTSIIAGARNLYFTNTENSLTNLDQQNVWSLNLQGQLNYKFNSRFSAYILAAVSEEPFFQGFGTPNLTTNKVIIPLAGAGAQYSWFKLNQFDFGFSAEAASYLGGQRKNLSISPGLGLKSALTMKYSLADREFYGGLGYLYKNQNSSNTTQSEFGPMLFINTSFSNLLK